MKILRCDECGYEKTINLTWSNPIGRKFYKVKEKYGPIRDLCEKCYPLTGKNIAKDIMKR